MQDLKAILFGSIGVIAETSDIQRRAYNAALAEAGVAWHWDPDTYRQLLTESGGKRRLRRLSAANDDALTEEQVQAIHARKTEIACAEVASGVSLRPGVAAVIEEALDRRLSLAFVTSTYRPNIDAIAEGAAGALPLDRFAAVLTTDDCERGKPAPDVYREALSRLGIQADNAIAIEDSATSVRAAKAAGLYTIATPGEYTAGQDFSAADRVLQSLVGVSIGDLTPNRLSATSRHAG